MESIFKEDKEQRIMDMIEEDKEELKSLALQTIKQMQHDIEKT